MGLILFYAPLTNAAVYKIVDEQTGRITFTDNPQKYEQQVGKKISQMTIVAPTTNSSASANNSTPKTSAPQTPASPATSTSNSSANSNTSPASVSPRVNYQLTFIEPSSERVYRRPAQTIDVRVQLKPALQAGDIVTIYLDDKQVAQGLSASIATVELLPGAHTLKVMVSNEKGQSITQISQTVYIIQNTAILQNNKKIAKQLLAYQKLPWHQKILLKMRQENIQFKPPANKPAVDTPMTLEEPVIR